MPIYYTKKPTGNERYNIIIPNVEKDIPGHGSYIIGSINLKNVTSEIATAIAILCEAGDIRGTFELVKPKTRK
jgi:hypothetical protein